MMEQGRIVGRRPRVIPFPVARVAAMFVVLSACRDTSIDDPPPPTTAASAPIATPAASDPSTKSASAPPAQPGGSTTLDPAAAVEGPPKPKLEPVPSCEVPCEPRDVATAHLPSALTLDASRVFFISGGNLQAVPRSGGKPSVLQSEIETIVAQAPGRLLLCQRTRVLDHTLMTLDTGTGTMKPLARAEGCFAAVYGTDVFYVGVGLEGGPKLQRIPITGGTPSTILSPARRWSWIGADASAVFFSAPDGIHRIDLAAGRSRLLTAPPLGDTPTLFGGYVYWSDAANLNRIPTAGGATTVVASFHTPNTFASAGPHLYWGGDEAWLRLDSAAKADGLVRFATPDNVKWIAADESEVFWAVWHSGSPGKIRAVQTCGCNERSLVPTPAIREAKPPPLEQHDEFRWGSANVHGMVVEVRDLSLDEWALAAMAVTENDGEIEPSTAWIPKRLAVGHPFRAATQAGVVEATASSYDVSEGGEGTHFYLGLASPGAEGAALVVDAKTGPKLSALRPTKSDPKAVRRVLPGLRTALRAAKIPGVNAATLTAADVQAVPGAFPAPYTTLVTVEMAAPEQEDGDVDLDVISAFVLTDKDGNVAHAIHDFDRRLESFSIDYLVDIAQDEVDEVVFGSRYYEGEYTLLLEWNANTPTTLTLSGDGS